MSMSISSVRQGQLTPNFGQLQISTKETEQNGLKFCHIISVYFTDWSSLTKSGHWFKGASVYQGNS